MALKSILVAAAVTIASASVASAASVYKVFDHKEGGSPEHTLWFSGDNPPGATNNNGEKNHFLVAPGHGLFTIFDEVAGVVKARLEATVKNADGQGFDLLMDMTQDTVNSYDAKGPKGNPDLSKWKFFTLDSGSLTAHPGSGLDDYDIVSLMSPANKDYAIQFGLGANDKDSFLGLSSWIKMRNTNCDEQNQTGDCTLYGGDINVSLEPVPLPVGIALLPVGLGLLGGMRLRQKKKAAKA